MTPEKQIEEDGITIAEEIAQIVRDNQKDVVFPNIQEVRVLNFPDFPEQKAPIIKIEPPVVNVKSPRVNLPAPIVNIESPIVNIDTEKLVKGIDKVEKTISYVLEEIKRPEENILDGLVRYGRIKVEVDKVGGGGGGGGYAAVQSKNVSDTIINPATEEKQLPDNHRVTVSNPTANPETGLATSVKQTELNSLIETLQELNARLMVLVSMANSGAPALRVIPIASVSTAVTGTVTATVASTSITNFGTGIPAKEMSDDMNNLLAVMANSNNAVAA